MKGGWIEAAGIQLYEEPVAWAQLTKTKNPDLKGTVCFYPLWQGTLVNVSVTGLPYTEGPCTKQIFGFHLHEGDTHYDPTHCPHPMHAGDFPVLFGNHGCALMTFYTERFYPEQTIGKTVVIHEMPDDFRSQPSGDSGEKIAEGNVTLFKED